MRRRAGPRRDLALPLAGETLREAVSFLNGGGDGADPGAAAATLVKRSASTLAMWAQKLSGTPLPGQICPTSPWVDINN